MSDIRNRVHDPLSKFSEQDLALFYWVRVITSQIYYATMFNLGKNISANVKANAEKVAEQLLSKIKE